MPPPLSSISQLVTTNNYPKQSIFNEEPSHMSQLSNRITPEVIRSVMPPHRLSPALVPAALAALLRPPQDTTRLARRPHRAPAPGNCNLMPANAMPARIAARSIISRKLAHALATLAHTPGTKVPAGLPPRSHRRHRNADVSNAGAIAHPPPAEGPPLLGTV
jgi:hypothetical protein